MDLHDTHSWYRLHNAYQQGDVPGNPDFWLCRRYFNTKQLHDTLDPYSYAIRIHPYTLVNLGNLDEKWISAAIDIYIHASEFDPADSAVSQRLLLKTAQATDASFLSH